MKTEEERLVLSSLTDEELLKHVYLKVNPSFTEVELARRLEHALDELASKPVSIEQVLQQHGANP